jgi:dTDP-4-amino-4,6-dideoxygalactose transaminase
MKIPMVDLRAQYLDIKDELSGVLEGVLSSCQFILGPNVAEFEREAAEYIGTKHAVAVANGTEALHLALAASGIGAGDEVITSPFTFIATAEAVTYTGARPVFVDVEQDTFNIDPAKVQNALSDKTKCILPVHLFGHPARVGPLLEFAVTNGLSFIEDCAQSFGAHYKFTRTGSFGDAGCFSFFPSKNLGCYGDGGMVTTDSGSMAERLRSLRNHGSIVRYHHDEIGYNSRLDEIQAGILRVKLKRIETYNKLRRDRAKQYGELLAGIPGVKTPVEHDGYFHVYHQYTILTENRDAVMKALSDRGIASMIYYPIPLHLQKSYADLGYRKGDFPMTESLADRVLSLPMYPELRPEDVDLVCETIRSCF